MEFVVLPDHQAATDIIPALRPEQRCNVIPHASGRPWIVGRWPAENVLHVTAGDRQIALLGYFGADVDELRRELARISNVRQLDPLVRRLTGGFHLVADISGEIRFQGSLSGTYQVFHCRRDGIAVAASRSRILADLTCAPVADENLALQMLAPSRPWPLNERSAWRGIAPVPMGEYLTISDRGAAGTVRWWSPPRPDTPLSDGVTALREALRTSVAARTQDVGLISADLSGGMDSTSLSFLAGQSATQLLTLRWVYEDAANDDGKWGEMAAAGLPQAEHLVLSARDLPRWYARLTDVGPDSDGPYAWIRTRAQVESLVQRVADRGSTRHLSGDGGDELFFLTPNYLHTLVRQRPLQSIAHLRSYRAMSRAGVGDVLRGLRGSASFGQWFRTSADRLRTPPGRLGNDLDFDWGTGPVLPPWASDATVDTVRSAMLEIASSDPQPLSGVRAQHASLQDVRSGGETIRRTDLLTSQLGVSWHSPFYDDRVVEAALRIRLEDRADPYLYKPALAAAMRTIVPDELLGRATKAEFSADAYAGLRRHRQELLDLCDDLELARRGLVDADALRSAVLGLHTSARTLILLDGTLAAEVWLRSLTAVPQLSPVATEVSL